MHSFVRLRVRITNYQLLCCGLEFYFYGFNFQKNIPKIDKALGNALPEVLICLLNGEKVTFF